MNTRVMHMLHTLDVAVWDFGSTVRAGFKWADLQTADELILCVCSDRCEGSERAGGTCDSPAGHTCENCTRTGRGLVVETWIGKLRDVPARFIEYEHEERSRMYAGLLASMRKAYGNGFSPRDYVTVVLYRRVA